MNRSIRQNAKSNFLAGVLPALVLLATIPVLVRGLGTAEYGLLIVVTSVAGYLSVLDVNVTTGSVKFVAEAHAVGDQDRVSATLSFGLLVYFCIALLGAGAIFFGSDWLASWFSRSGQVDSSLATQAFMVAAIGFAIGQLYSYLISVPQALQRYDLSGRVEIVLGVFAPLLTAGAVYFGGRLTDVLWLRNGIALMGLCWLAVVIRRLLPWLRWNWPPSGLRRQLMGFSAYAYLARLAAITYQHGDKLVIASVLDVKSVAVYTVPVLLANRLFSTTYRITQVIFPASSALLSQGRQADVHTLLLRSTKFVFAFNACVVVMLWFLGAVFLRVWVGAEFAGIGFLVLLLVSCGALADSLTNGPSLVTDSSGRPDVTGKLSVVRAGVGLTSLLVGAKLGGVVGVALSHFLVSSFFTVVFLSYFSKQVFPMSLLGWLKNGVLPGLGVASAGLIVGSLVLASLGTAGPVAAVSGAVSAALMMAGLAWRFVLSPTDHEAIVKLLRRRGIP